MTVSPFNDNLYCQVKILESNYQFDSLTNREDIIEILNNTSYLWSHSVVSKGVVSEMNFPRFYFSKQLIYLHEGWPWASMKWDPHTKSTSLSETNRSCRPTSGATTSSWNASAIPAADVLPFLILTWPFVVICMPNMGGFDRSDIGLRSINIKAVSGWCESQFALGESVCRCD